MFNNWRFFKCLYCYFILDIINKYIWRNIIIHIIIHKMIKWSIWYIILAISNFLFISVFQIGLRGFIHSWHLYSHLWMLNEKKIDKMKIESSKWNPIKSIKKKLIYFFILYVNLIFQFDSACHFGLLSRIIVIFTTISNDTINCKSIRIF